MNTNNEEYKRAEAIVKLSGIYPEDFISSSTFDGVVKMVATITAHNELSKYTRAAMQGLCAREKLYDSFRDLSEDAIAIARATLAALEKEKA